ncbi:MAG: thiolase family protein [Lachnospiraceae bacterium]
MSGRKVVIAGSNRTAIGKMGGALKDTPSNVLGTLVIKEALKRSGVPADQIDYVYMGCVLQTGLGQNVARQCTLNAGIPVKTPAVTLNVVCGSGLQAINIGSRLIACGEADVVIAGGVENMSMAPYYLRKARFGYRMNAGTLEDSFINDALTDAFNHYHMGITAENVAEQWGITRQDLDEFSAESQRKAAEAQAAGRFKDEILPVEVKQKKKTVIFDQDEGVRAGTTVEVLSKLRPAFKPDGIVTAGNSSGINDAAAAVVLLSEDKAKELGVKPEAYWIDGDIAGCEPSIMGVGPIYASRKVFDKTGFTIDDMDLYEANEAFAAQSIAVGRELHFDPDKLNVNGGAIALGHPVGCSGARILVTLIHALKQKNAHRGLATLCVGGGMGVAAIIENAD